VTLQQIDGLVHVTARNGLRRHPSTGAASQSL
jgi:hypothetical protein